VSARTIHPFPARMAPEIALGAIPARDGEALTILDPMCGSGTVLSVALKRGHNAIGVDIDPLAVMMSRVTVSHIVPKELSDVGQRVRAATKTVQHTRPWGDDEETQKFVEFWFAKNQIRELIALTSAIGVIEDQSLKLALQVALSRIIVTKSPEASLAADTSHSRPHRVQDESDYNVLAGFERSVAQLVRMLEKRSHAGVGSVSLGDARVLDSVESASVDLAVTSPPYLNALDYLRGHRLALVWFGYTMRELRVRRGSSIGAERNPDLDCSDVATSMVDVIEDKAADRSQLKRGMLERYAQDCLGFAAQLRRTVRPNGRAVIVVGNSTLRGNYIRNDLMTQMAMEQAGFVMADRYEREIPPSSRYMAITARQGSTITKRMRTEIVLTMDA
jgi:DNA modification methylase